MRLIGPLNESSVSLEGKTITALIDSGAQLSGISHKFAKQLKLKIHHLNTLLDIEGTGGIDVPYLGYVEARLKIDGIEGMDEDCLFLVVPDSNYTERVPISIGTLHIDRCLELLKKDEIPNLTKQWERALFPRYILKSANLKEPEFDLDNVKGTIKLTKKVTLAPFETIHVSAKSSVRGHFKRVLVLMEKLADNMSAVEPINSYSVLHPGSDRVQIALRNLSARSVTVQAKSSLATISAANEVPRLLAPKEINDNQSRDDIVQENGQIKMTPLNEEKQKQLFDKVDLTGTEDWTDDQKDSVKQLFTNFGKLFAIEQTDLGHTDLVKHKIKLDDYTPFKERYRRIPPHSYEEVRKHLREMIEVGAIRKSNSPWASAVVLVRKKDGSLRFCIDLRRLNARTIKDAYSLPRIEETLDCLNGAKYFTSLDLKSGYWQVEMDEDSKPFTAFSVGPLGFYECERMPFGLTNAPATFQRLMESCLGDLHLNWCIIYLDDIIVFSKTPEEHLQCLRGVFTKLASAGLKLKPSKCEFFKKKITYLGYVVSEDGIESDPKKTEAVRNWPVPKTVTEVRGFLGFTNQYRKFIPKYAQKAAPLNELISGENSKKKRKPAGWNSRAQKAFEELKELCCSAPILAYANYEKKFKIHTDASDLGLGAVLYQEDENGKDRVIAYASRSLNPAEKNYPAHKLEFLALKWAVTNRFHEYLYGGEFDVYTDNNPLTYVLTTAHLDATGQRWIASLANYTFSLHYKRGKSNIEADALSRIPRETEKVVIDAKSVQAIVSAMQLGDFTELNQNPNLLICKSARPVPQKYSNEDWVREQVSDPSLSQVIQVIKGNIIDKDNLLEDAKTMLRKKSKFIFRNNLLYKKNRAQNRNKDYLQFVLPTAFRKQALEACHDDIGHLGTERTLSLLTDRFYWPKQAKDVEQYIQTCPRCLKFKAIPERAELTPILATRPLELVHIDFLTIESGKTDKDINILVVTDHFTKYAQAFVTRSQAASVVANTLWERFFAHYGFPEKILSDQGRNFESKLISELCHLVQVKKLRTTPYRPEGNGACERFNRTLISMIGTLPPDLKVDWPQHVSTLTHGYNCTRNNATSYSPYYLMYGRDPLLPIDIEFGVFTPDISEVATHKYVQKLKHRLEYAYQKAKEFNERESLKNKRRFDRKVRCSKLEPGDYVLVRRKGFTGKHKIADHWEVHPYQVISQHEAGIPVFQIQSCGKDGKRRTLHRNMLFPLNLTIESDLHSSFHEDKSVKDIADLHKDDSDVNVSDEESLTEQPIYQGPLTRSRAKTLMKANWLMLNHFDLVEECTLEPKTGFKYYISKLVSTFRQLFR